MSPGGGEVHYDVDRLMSAAKQLDGFSDKAKRLKTEADATPAKGHEWGLIGEMTFADHYTTLATAAREHLGMISEFLTSAEQAMTGTAKNYAAANRAILDEISLLENDLCTND